MELLTSQNERKLLEIREISQGWNVCVTKNL